MNSWNWLQYSPIVPTLQICNANPVLQYAPKKIIPVSCPFNGKACSIPFPFISHSLPVHELFKFLSISVRSPCTFQIRFIFVMRLQSAFACGSLFYSLLKRAHAGQQFACGRKKATDSLTALIWIVLALASHASLYHTLCLRAFSLLFFRSVVVLLAKS